MAGSPRVGDPLDARLTSLISGAIDEVLLIAPFMKVGIVRQLLQAIRPQAKLTVVTRWKVEEIVAGISDLDVWLLVRERPNSSMRLLDHLHAKVYVADDTCLVGSANLTARALDNHGGGNLELLTQVSRSRGDVDPVVAEAFNASVPVTDELYGSLVSAVASAIQPDQLEHAEVRRWLPTYRQPSELLKAAAGLPSYSDSERQHARQQLRELGLSVAGRTPCREEVVGSLLTQPLVAAFLRQLELSGSMRFGEIRSWLLAWEPAEPSDPQALVRWMIEFLGDRVEYSRPGFSEVLALRQE